MGVDNDRKKYYLNIKINDIEINHIKINKEA